MTRVASHAAIGSISQIGAGVTTRFGGSILTNGLDVEKSAKAAFDLQGILTDGAIGGVFGGVQGLKKPQAFTSSQVQQLKGAGERELATLSQYGDSFDKMGTYVENPDIKVDWSQYAEHGVERMQQRGMTQEMVDSIVENGKVLSQNNGNKFIYITKEGVAIVSKNGKLITTWSSADFDSNMIEIIKKLFGE